MTILINHDMPAAAVTFAFGLIASGTTQANAVPIQARRNIFTTVAPSQACLMGMAGRPVDVKILNYGANVLTVFPPGGWSFNNGTVNASVTVAVNGSLTLYAGDPNESSWWTSV